MAKTSHQIEKEFIGGLKSETGKSLQEWLDRIKKSKLTKQSDIVNDLKNNHGFGHLYASLLAGIYLNGGQPVYPDPEEL